MIACGREGGPSAYRFAPRHSLKNFVWRGTALYLNPDRFLSQKGSAAPASHSFFEFPREKNQNGNGAAGAEGGNARYSARGAGFSITTRSERTLRVQTTTHAERAKSVGVLAKIGSSVF